MKKNLLLFAITFTFGMVAVQAQTDMTSSIVNPSFEDNYDAMATGWTYGGGADTYAWHVINNDGDETKTGENIMGLWNPTFGDPVVYQTISGLENGSYTVTADMMCSRNAASLRLTTQRIFANENSVLFGVEADSNYAESDLAILTDVLNEEISFAGHTVSPVGKENGPFYTCSVTTEVTDGTLELGVKTNGSDSEYDFTFPLLTDGDGWGWFKVDNFTLTYMGATNIEDEKVNTLRAYSNEGLIIVEGADDYKIYNINGSEVKVDRQLNTGIYIVVAGDQVRKVLVY